MEFECDSLKRERNIEKHGVDLLLGALIFENTTVEAGDTRHDYAETRVIAIGMVGARCFVTIYVRHGDVIRLISTRKGGGRDRKKYEEAVSRRDQVS